MSITRTLGGDRLGSGNNMKVRMHNYEMSTHDLGKVVRTTATTGTIIPLYCELVQNGDTWEMDLDTIVRTHPTVGPVFGTFKYQIDVFTADMRLYNKQLHNNDVGIGLNMQNVLFPQMVLNGRQLEDLEGDLNQQQVAPDSLLAYLGIRGFGRSRNGLGTGGNNDYARVEIRRNAMPLMAYWDIYKNYYTNKQEEIGYCISPIVEYIPATVTTIEITPYEGAITQTTQNTTNNISQGRFAFSPTASIKINGTNLTHELTVLIGGAPSNIKKISVYNAPFNEIEIAEDRTYILLKNATAGAAIWYDEEEEKWITGGQNGNAIIDGINVREFPLSNIDDVREQVFAQPKTSPLTIGYSNNHTVTTEPYLSTTGQAELSGNSPTLQSDCLSKFEMSGLGLKTYMSDRFNNWLNKAWVETVNATSAIQIVDGSFTMDALLLSRKIYDQQNRITISGGTYDDWLTVTWGNESVGAPEMPVYRGGFSADLVFDEVVSSSSATSGGANEPLGTLGGRGNIANKRGGKIRFKANEHGYVMVLLSITPRIDYHQGNKWHYKLETMDDIHKPAYDQLGFQDLLTDEYVAWDTYKDEDGNEVFKSTGKQLSWTQYQTNWNEVHGNFARENREQFMVITRRYENDEDGNLLDGTTYIDPTKYNYMYANLGLENQPYWVQVSIGAEVRRKMKAHQIPNL